MSKLHHPEEWARQGFAVFPCCWPVGAGCSCGKADCKSPGKHPHAKLAPRGLHSASTDEETVRRWFADERLNYGIVPREGTWVLDIDTHKGGMGALQRLEHTRGALPRTLTIASGGGGEHRWFRLPDGVVGPQVQDREDIPGLECRATGRGYVVGPGSRHTSGRCYQVIDEAELAMVPRWLLEVFELPRESGSSEATAALPFDAPGRADADRTRVIRKAQAMADTIRAAQKGSRHATVRDCAGVIGRHLACYELDDGAVRALLVDAARVCGCGDPERTVDAGLAYGRKHPEPLEERPAPIRRPFELPSYGGHLDQPGDPGPEGWTERGSSGTDAVEASNGPEPFPELEAPRRPTPPRSPPPIERWGAPLRLSASSLSAAPPPERWLLRWPDGSGCLPRGALGVVAAEGGLGKTRAVIELAACLASGLPWLAPTVRGEVIARVRKPGGFPIDEEAKGARSLLLLAEETARAVTRRLHWAFRDVGADAAEVAERVVIYPLADRPGLSLTVSSPHVPTRPTDAWETLRALVEKHDPDLVVLDPLSAFSSPETETSAEAATQLFALLAQLTRTADEERERTVIVCHHTSKVAQREEERAVSALRGSTGIGNRARWVGLLSPATRGKASLPSEFSVVKANDARRGFAVLAADKDARGRLHVETDSQDAEKPKRCASEAA